MSKSTFLIVNLSKHKSFIEDNKKILLIAGTLFLRLTLNETAVQGSELVKSERLNINSNEIDTGLILFLLGETIRQINTTGLINWLNYIVKKNKES